MNRSTLWIALIALIFIFLLVLFAGGKSLPRDVTNAARNELEASGKIEEDFAAKKRLLATRMAEAELAFKAPRYEQDWPRVLSAAEESLKARGTEEAQLRKFLEAESPEDSERIKVLTAALAGRRAAAMDAVDRCLQEAELRVNTFKAADAARERLARGSQVLAAADLGPLKTVVAAAKARWPNQAQELDRRYAAIATTLTEATQDLTAMTAASGGSFELKSAADLDRLIAVDRALARALQVAEQDLEPTGRLWRATEELDWSVDRLLVDMDDQGSGANRWRHQIKDVRTKALQDSGAASESDQPTPAEVLEGEPRWINVPRATFERHLKDLGMVIAHKPAGQFEDALEEKTSAPGYAYMCPPEQKSNRYGYWSSGPGGSFWNWYGPYLLMSSLLQGPRHGPISSDYYRDYRSSRDLGRSWYGPTTATGTPTYGSESTYGRTRYASSRYAQRGGYTAFRDRLSNRTTNTPGNSRSPATPVQRSSRPTPSSASRSSPSRSGSRFGGGK